jgi:hypothetical protein
MRSRYTCRKVATATLNCGDQHTVLHGNCEGCPTIFLGKISGEIEEKLISSDTDTRQIKNRVQNCRILVLRVFCKPRTQNYEIQVNFIYFEENSWNFRGQFKIYECDFENMAIF